MTSVVEQSRKATLSQFGILCVALVAVLALNLQLWGFDTPPLIDWPNHLARHILQCGAPGALQIGQYYFYDLILVPNLTSELVHSLALACNDPVLTQKVLIQFATFGTVLSTVILYRAIWGAWSVWPLLSVLVMHNMAWAYGFENFALSIPLTLLALSLWFAFSARGPFVRLTILWPFALVIYVCHLYAFGFLMLVVGLLELHDLTSRFRGWTLVKRALAVLLLIGLISLLPAVQLASALQSSPEIDAGGFLHGGAPTILMTVVSPFASFGHFNATQETLWVAVSGIFGILALVSVLRMGGAKIELDNRVRFIAPVMIVICLIVPFSFSGVAFTNIRFPCLLAPLLIAAVRVRFSLRTAGLFTAAILAVMAAKTTWITSKWDVHERQVAELRNAAAVLSQTDRLLVARDGLSHEIRLHSHSASYVLRDRGPYWTGMFTGGNSLFPNAEYQSRDHTQPFPIDWRALMDGEGQTGDFAPDGYLHNWSSFYSHVLVLREPGSSAIDGSAIGPLSASGSFFDIVAVR